MSLQKQYNEFYKTSQVKENIPEISLTGWPKNRVEAIMHSVSSANSVMDIGCGNGHLLYQLRNKFKSLIGLEYSSERLEKAKLNLESFAFVPVLGSAEDMNTIESGSIECIVSADTIEHIPDVYTAVDEIFRILTPGGQLVINTPNIAFIKKRVLLLCGRFPSTSQANEGMGSDIMFDGGHLHYFTYRSLSLLLQKSGFIIKGSVGYGKLGKIHDVYPSLLSGGAQLVAYKPV